MAVTYTTPHGLFRVGAAGDIVPVADQQQTTDVLNDWLIELAEAYGSTGVIFSATDWNASAVPGALQISMSAGAGLIGGADVKKLSRTTGAETLTASDGVTASQVNYVYRVRGASGDPDDWGTWSVNVTGVAPANSMLCAVVLMSGTEALSCNNLPASRVNWGEGLLDQGRPATGHVRIAVNANDADTLTITAGGLAVVYEFESAGGVTAGRVPVTIGGSAGATATNLRAAILANQGHLLNSAVHGTDTTVVDLALITPGGALTLAESTAGARVVVQDNAEELARAQRRPYGHRRTITAEDVTRGRLRVDTGLASLSYWRMNILTSATNSVRIAATGAQSASGGVLEMDNAGGTAWSAGNVLDVLAWGT